MNLHSEHCQATSCWHSTHLPFVRLHKVASARRRPPHRSIEHPRHTVLRRHGSSFALSITSLYRGKSRLSLPKLLPRKQVRTSDTPSASSPLLRCDSDDVQLFPSRRVFQSPGKTSHRLHRARQQHVPTDTPAVPEPRRSARRRYVRSTPSTS